MNNYELKLVIIVLQYILIIKHKLVIGGWNNKKVVDSKIDSVTDAITGNLQVA
jgi:hypothetical protein